MKTYICKATILIRVEAENEEEAEGLASLEMDIGDIDWVAEEMGKNKLKHFMASVTIYYGDHETIASYCFKSADLESAEKEVNEAFAIGDDDWEQQAELYSLVEVTADEYAVLSKYV